MDFYKFLDDDFDVNDFVSRAFRVQEDASEQRTHMQLPVNKITSNLLNLM